jgi:formylglycine-generating enzyme required for sulfatase activity
MAEKIPYIRVFISSPGDVNAERKIALDAIEYFPNRPTYREKVAFRVVAWDKPGAGTAMLGTLTPQEAINRGLPKPSECDIVIVIFWSRMGTPFTDTDGKEYLSGTHWEMLDALNSKQTETVIFRRTEEKLFKSSDKKGQEQNDRVAEFFASDLFYREDGSIVRGVNQYETPDDFRRDFEIFFEELVVRLLKRYDEGEAEPPSPLTTQSAQAQSEIGNVTTITAELWEDSPFPGLRAFTEKDAPIFFGRGRETDSLIQQVIASRFVAVVGASGSGKSSLVGAGLIPRLKANGIEGSADWLYARFTPGTGKNPFEALVKALMDVVPSLQIDDPFDYDDKLEERAQRLQDKPQRLSTIIEHALKDELAHVNVFLFIDQFEELFTLANSDYAAPFAKMLAQALTPNPSPSGRGEQNRLHVIVTMRHDFYHKAVEIPDLAELLRAEAVFSLAIPRRDALREMIERPAERAGLELENGLVERILNDTGDQSGNLALMAYVLDELYKLSGDGTITDTDYEALGGVQGAIGTRAEQTYADLPGTDEEKTAWIQRVFHELVAVDERGTATRRRVPVGRIAEDDYERISAFVDARLLTSDATDGTAVLEVAHEALFRSWERLRDWIAEAQEDLILLRQVRTAAEDWHKRGRPDFLLWPQERLILVYAMQERLKPDLSATERDFIEPEQTRLLRELETLPKIADSHERRRDIGDRLAVIGDSRPGVGLRDDGLPDMQWLAVKGSDGKYKFEFGEFEVPDFYIAKYLVTYAQYQAFAESDYENPQWWEGFPEKYRPQQLAGARSKMANAPRDTISWYQSVAFSRWLDARLREQNLWHLVGEGLSPLPKTGEHTGSPLQWQIRIPTEWEWQWATQNGIKAWEYPWGEWQEGYANTNEAGLSRSTSVGMYPHGKAECGALDMAGNLWEWCANNYDESEIIDGSNTSSKVLRGGSFGSYQGYARASYRYDYGPGYGDYSGGCRLVVAPIAPL